MAIMTNFFLKCFQASVKSKNQTRASVDLGNENNMTEVKKNITYSGNLVKAFVFLAIFYSFELALMEKIEIILNDRHFYKYGVAISKSINEYHKNLIILAISVLDFLIMFLVPYSFKTL
jgi:hypothetical protein